MGVLEQYYGEAQETSVLEKYYPAEKTKTKSVLDEYYQPEQKSVLEKYYPAEQQETAYSRYAISDIPAVKREIQEKENYDRYNSPEAVKQRALEWQKQHPAPPGIPTVEEETLKQDVYDPIDVAVDVATGFTTTPFKAALRKGVPLAKATARTVGRELVESGLVGSGMQVASNAEIGPVGTMAAGLATGAGGKLALTGARQLGKTGARGAVEAVGSKPDDQTLGGFVREHAEKFYKKAWDENRDIKRLVDDVEKSSGKKLAPENNPYFARMASKNAASANTTLDMREFAKAVENIHVKEKSAFERFLIAKRSIDQVKNGIDPEIPIDQAHVIIRDAPAHFKEAQGEISEFASGMLAKLRRAGLIAPGVEQHLRAKWGDSYVPFFREFQDCELENLNVEDFQKVLGEKKTINKMTGSNREILSPLDSYLEQIEAINKRISRNETHKGLYHLAEIDSNGLVKEIGAKEAKERGSNAVVAWVDGNPHYLDVPADIYETLNQVSRGDPNMFIKMMRPFAKVLRKGAVEYNPVFPIYNTIRDSMMASITSKSGLLPFEGHAKGLYHILKRDDIWREAMESGSVGSEFIAQMKDGKVVADNLLKGGDTLGRINRAVNPAHWMSVINETLEKAPRMGEYAALRGDPSITQRLARAFGRQYDPVSIPEAADAYRDLTLNFGRFGTDTKTPNEVIAFFNAAMQGGDKLVRTFKDAPGKTALRTNLYIVLPSVALWMRNHNDPRYQELSQDQKDRYWWISTENNMIPVIKPFEFAMFANVIERGLSRFKDEDPKAFEGFANNVAETTLPAIIPTLPLIMGEWQANYNTWQDRSIVPMREQKLPPEYQWGPETSETAKWLGKMTGLSPRKIEHAIYGFTAKTGRYVTRAIDKVAETQGVRGEAPERQLLPKPYKYPQSVDDFYTRKEELDGMKKAQDKTGRRMKSYNPLEHTIINRIAREIAPMWQAVRDIYGDKNLSGEEKARMMDEINHTIMNLTRMSLGRKPIDTETHTIIGKDK